MKEWRNLTWCFILLLFAGCAKDTGNQPTEEPDTYYVKCLINGQPWENCCDDCNDQWGWGSNRSIYSNYDDISGYIEIGVSNNCELNNGMNLTSDSLYTLQKESFRPSTYYNDHSLDRSCQQFKLLSSLSNYIQVDSIESERIYGAFSAIFANSCGDTVRLTEGEFYVKKR